MGGEWRSSQLHNDSTTIRVEHAVRLHIVPQLGGQQIGRIRHSHIQGWVKDRAGELAPSTIRVVFGYLNAMMSAAVRDRRIAANPCVDVRLPDLDGSPRFIPSPAQIHRIADLLPVRLAPMVYIAAGCGLRLGEVLGLEAGDVDFGAQELHVRRQLKVLKGRTPFLGPVKTKTSVRTVELPKLVWNALDAHLQDGVDPVDIDDDTDPRRPTRRPAHLLFRGASGDPINAATFSRTWATA